MSKVPCVCAPRPQLARSVGTKFHSLFHLCGSQYARQAQRAAVWWIQGNLEKFLTSGSRPSTSGFWMIHATAPSPEQLFPSFQSQPSPANQESVNTGPAHLGLVNSHQTKALPITSQAQTWACSVPPAWGVWVGQS